MNTLNPEVDTYLAEGCGRCPLGGTPDCKVHTWREEMALLRQIVLDCGLTEELKWKVACYTFQQKNILMLSALKGFCCISFFKGALLKDPHQVLTAPGENSQAARLMKFTRVEEVITQENILRDYIREAVEVEKAGLKIEFKEKNALVFPEELHKKFEEYPDFKAAFYALTPGRQRGYNLYFSQPKQAKTRTARIEKYVTHILKGKGFHDR